MFIHHVAVVSLAQHVYIYTAVYIYYTSMHRLFIDNFRIFDYVYTRFFKINIEISQGRS